MSDLPEHLPSDPPRPLSPGLPSLPSPAAEDAQQEFTSDASQPRIPNLLHTALLLLVAVACLILVYGAFLPFTGRLDVGSAPSQRVLLAIQSLADLLALAVSWFLFPLLWRRSFLSGIRWNARGASPALVGFGLVLGFATQVVESLLPTRAPAPIDKLVGSEQLIWPLVIFGTLIAPLAEEIFFRGFLLPALGWAAEWLLTVLLHRDGLTRWQHTTRTSPAALIAASLLTSAAFGAVHGPQLGSSLQAILVLAAVSLILCAVRLRRHSVAASTLVHASYNFSLFLTLFIVSGGFRHLDKLR